MNKFIEEKRADKLACLRLFKGGTSLSKGWNLIQRFSGELSKGDIKKLRRKSYQFITEVFTEELNDKFVELGFKEVTVKYRGAENHNQEPFSKRTFGTFVSQIYSDNPFTDKPITIPVVNPERLSRHLYDIEKLSQKEYVEIALRDTGRY